MTLSQLFVEQRGWRDDFRLRSLLRSGIFWLAGVLMLGGALDVQAEDNYDLLVISYVLPFAAILGVNLQGARMIRRLGNRPWREEIALSGVCMEENFTPNAARWLARPFIICAAGAGAAHLFSAVIWTLRESQPNDLPELLAEPTTAIFLSLMANLSLGAIGALISGIGLSRLLAGYCGSQNGRRREMALSFPGSVAFWMVISIAVPAALVAAYVMLLAGRNFRLAATMPATAVAGIVSLSWILRIQWLRASRKYFEFE